jgi:hypothetical protein
VHFKIPRESAVQTWSGPHWALVVQEGTAAISQRPVSGLRTWVGEHWHTGFPFCMEQVSKSPQDMTAQGSTQDFLPLMLMLQRALGGQSAWLLQGVSLLQPWRGLSGLPEKPSRQMQVL